ncbi:MAG: hypothetical protein IPQ08_05715 [Chitinophagaceae bacterium]|jgi:hypothetical protein|nr:hypothetical protein [Chitinophagaceae bacterium]
MLLLTIGEDKDLIVTLNEKRTLDNGYYLFVFENVTTRDIVTKIFSFSEDESDYPERFNSFPLSSTVFQDENTGDWRYKVYEQSSSTNTDPTGLTEVERGIMKLRPATDFSFTEYTGTTSFKQYEG